MCYCPVFYTIFVVINHCLIHSDMLVYNFKRHFLSRGVKFPVSWLMQRGFSDKFASGVANERYRKMSLSDLERLCYVFQCTPNDLLEWTPNKTDEDVKSHFMAPLFRGQKVMDLTKTLNSVPFDKLLEIEKLIQAELEKGNE